MNENLKPDEMDRTWDETNFAARSQIRMDQKILEIRYEQKKLKSVSIFKDSDMEDNVPGKYKRFLPDSCFNLEAAVCKTINYIGLLYASNSSTKTAFITRTGHRYIKTYDFQNIQIFKPEDFRNP